MQEEFLVRSSLDPRVSARGITRMDGFQETLEAIEAGLIKTASVSAGTSKRAAHKILNIAQKHVPYDTGTLFNSGRVTDGGGNTIGSTEVEHVMIKTARGYTAMIEYLVVFGDDLADYALFVHENVQGVTWKPGTGPYPTEPKMDRFLATAADIVAPEITPTLAKAIHQAWVDECARQKPVIAALAQPRSMAPRLVKRT